MQSPPALALVVLALLGSTAFAEESVRADPASGGGAAAPPQEVWLELSAPAAGETRAGPVSWLEVLGWAGAGRHIEHDVVIALDVSGSTAYASGADVDGDGRVGRARNREDWRNFNPRFLSSDAEDTILAAELAATRRLVELLEPSRTRIAIVSFEARSRVIVPLASEPARVYAGLENLRDAFGSGMTDLAQATRLAVALLGAQPGEQRQRSLLILSDGYPTSPGTEADAAAAALEAANGAGAAGIRIYCFALGIQQPPEGDVFAEMARVSGGRHVHLEKPGEIVHELPRINLVQVAAVELENLSAGVSGRAVRVFPDGSFDGYLPLVPGTNRIRATARGDRGGVRTEERVVHYEKREPRDAIELAESEKLLRRLRDRTVETGLALEGEAARHGSKKELELAPQPDPNQL